MTPSDLEISLIKIYRKVSAPIYSTLSSLGLNLGCSYNPSCSVYTEQAIRKYGVIRGSAKGLARILRCGSSRHTIDDPLD